MGKIGHKPTNFIWMRFEKDGECDVCVSHKGNQDGYIRKRWADGAEMFHRFIYRALNDLDRIPHGYTLHHLCGNRACCNPRHLVMMSYKDHTAWHNLNRDFKIGKWKTESGKTWRDTH